MPALTRFEPELIAPVDWANRRTSYSDQYSGTVSKQRVKATFDNHATARLTSARLNVTWHRGLCELKNCRVQLSSWVPKSSSDTTQSPTAAKAVHVRLLLGSSLLLSVILPPHLLPKNVHTEVVHACTGIEALYRGIPLLFLDHGTRRGEGSASRPGCSLPPGKDPVPIVQKAGCAPGPIWTGAENFSPTGIRSPDRPARNQSLYRLSYRAHKLHVLCLFFLNCQFCVPF